MEENKELLTVEEPDEGNDNYDDSDEYVKAKTFPVDETWPDELKKQVEQLNQMAAMINADPVVEDDEEPASDEESEDDGSEEEEAGELPVQNVSTEENQTFGDIF